MLDFLLVHVLWLKLLRQTNNTEPAVAVATARRVVVTVGNATVGNTAVPATAPKHAVGPRRRTCRVVSVITYIRTGIPVFAPLPYIARHIIDTQRIRAF